MYGLDVMMNSSASAVSECPICGSADTRACVHVAQVPVYCNMLWPSREAALAAPRGDISLRFCSSCGHAFNSAFDPGLVEYTQAYENSLHFSQRFQEYAKSLAIELIERYDLHGKQIIELGSGQGDFLTLLCELGDNRGLGFDPSYVPESGGSRSRGPVTFVQDYYSERYAHYQADLICCRHVLEHVHEPIEFLSVVRRAVGDRFDTVVFFEVPNLSFMLGDLAIWDIIYEHYSYFSGCSLAYALSRCGFAPSRVGETFARQFLTIEAFSGDRTGTPEPCVSDELDPIAVGVRAFGEQHRDKVEGWQCELEEMARAGRRVVVWGAGSKGVTFLNVLREQAEIEFVVDINPRKEGMHVAGTGQRIVPPSYLREYRPDAVILMNSIYEREIRQVLEDMDLSPDIASA
jgi:SAM-dependent methyltransferase